MLRNWGILCDRVACVSDVAIAQVIKGHSVPVSWERLLEDLKLDRFDALTRMITDDECGPRYRES